MEADYNKTLELMKNVDVDRLFTTPSLVGDVITKITTYLGVPELLSMRAVCKLWKRYATII